MVNSPEIMMMMKMRLITNYLRARFSIENRKNLKITNKLKKISTNLNRNYNLTSINSRKKNTQPSCKLENSWIFKWKIMSNNPSNRYIKTLKGLWANNLYPKKMRMMKSLSNKRKPINNISGICFLKRENTSFMKMTLITNF